MNNAENGSKSLRIIRCITKFFYLLVDVLFVLFIFYVIKAQHPEVIKNLHGGYYLLEDDCWEETAIIRYELRDHYTNRLPTLVDDNDNDLHVEILDYNNHYILAITDNNKDKKYWLIDKTIPYDRMLDSSGRKLCIPTPVTGPLDSSTYYHLKDSLLVRGRHWERQSK